MSLIISASALGTIEVEYTVTLKSPQPSSAVGETAIFENSSN